jgi:hypothetical protein
MKNRKTKDTHSGTGSVRNSRGSRETHQGPVDAYLHANPIPDLPPNECIRKHPDEVYGDTEIPHRKARKW